ncbi:Mis12 protein-domain-containing protein, partial [Gorgonomyces haynaldii]
MQQLIEQLGFSPVQFVDNVISSVNTQLYTCTSSLESLLVQQNTQIQGISSLEQILEHSIDKRFDRFELFVLKNILCVPQDLVLVLDHYKGLEFKKEEEEQLLDKEIEDTRKRILALSYVNSQIKQKKEQITKNLQVLKQFYEQLNKLKIKCQELDLFPMDERVAQAQQVVVSLESLMQQIDVRTRSTEWTKVALIGQADPYNAQGDMQAYFKATRLNQEKDPHCNKLPAWEITRDYRDAFEIAKL